MTFWISTDLDGTLLDHNSYRYDDATEALEYCQKRKTPIVLNTSKTESETKALHQCLNLSTPMVVENGSALIFNKSTLKPKVFGQPRSIILDFIDNARTKHDIKLSGFNDLGIRGIIDNTGLSIQAAELAADKHYSEPFIWHGSNEQLNKFTALAKQHDLAILKGGRFYHLQGQTNKGKPLCWLQDNLEHLFSTPPENPSLICLGDNQNDVAMLNVADYPVWVRSPITPPPLSNSNTPIYTKNLGPKGWNEVVLELLTTRS